MDFYVFLTYLPRIAEYKDFSAFDRKCIIVPTSKLAERIKSKVLESGDKYHFMFNIDGKKVVEKRHEIVDYSEFLNG